MKCLSNALVAFVLVSFLPASLFAQDSVAYKRSNVRIAPLKLVDLVHPGLEVIAERYIGRRYSAQVSGAWLTNLFGIAPYNSFSGYRVLVAGKYFFQPDGVSERLYISPEVGWSRMRYEGRWGFHAEDDTAGGGIGFPANVYQDEFNVEKRVVFFNTRLGLQMQFNRFVTDISLGVGVKLKRVTLSNLDYPDYVLENPRHHPNFYHQAYKPVDGAFFNLPATISIGYCF